MIQKNHEQTVDEQELWTNGITAKDWAGTIKSGKSVFSDLYVDTRNQVIRHCKEGNYDCIIDVGCGTGEIVGELKDLNVPLFGMDINPDFIKMCKDVYGSAVDWEVANACELQKWWSEKQAKAGKKFSKPYVMCCNNTMGIMPEEIRGTVVHEMMAVAGSQGKCLVTYWNGNFFPCGIKEYYMNNPELCGKFELRLPYVDFRNRMLHTKSGYVSVWKLAHELVDIYKTYDVEIKEVKPQAIDGDDVPMDYDFNYVQEMVMGVCVVFAGDSSLSPQEPKM